MELTRINALALKVSLGDSFTGDDRDDAVTLLTRIAKVPDLKRSRDIMTNMGDILNAFASAGLVAQIDEIFRLYRDEILGRARTVEVLLHHYGREICGRPQTPSGDDTALRAFEALERVSPGHKQGELALAYRTIHAYKVSGAQQDPAVGGHITRSLAYNDEDAVRFLSEILVRTRAENWQKRPTEHGIELQRLTRGLLRTHAAAFAETYGVQARDVERLAERGVSKEEVGKVAAFLVASARTRSR